VTAEIDGKQESFEGDQLLLGAGRIANLSGVEQAGLATNRLGITVDDRMRTNVGGVWAIGDCIGDPRSPKLAHVAFTQAEVAVDTILGEDAVMDYDVVPNVVYTHPEVAQVGLTEAQAKGKYGAEVKVARFSFRASARALALGESEGQTKIVTAGKDQRIVGVHIVGPQASELIAKAREARVRCRDIRRRDKHAYHADKAVGMLCCVAAGHAQLARSDVLNQEGERRREQRGAPLDSHAVRPDPAAHLRSARHEVP